MKILSLFDGCSCAKLALERAGLKVDKYYASEIDKYTIEISKKNFPEIIQLGSITEWKTWKIEKPDLIIGGSPCQGFSFAGKQLNFDDPRSKLFFKFVDILNHYKPKYFLLENVKMKKEYEKVISDLLGVEPVEINSALVSAQNRKRLYWCNWKVEQLEDKGIVLKDITEDESNICGASRGRYLIDGKRQDHKIKVAGLTKQRIEIRKDQKTNSLTTVQKDNLVSIDKKEWRKLTPIECERLQTLPDNYTEGVCNTQRYKMLGNGFTVNIIVHILRALNE